MSIFTARRMKGSHCNARHPNCQNLPVIFTTFCLTHEENFLVTFAMTGEILVPLMERAMGILTVQCNHTEDETER